MLHFKWDFSSMQIISKKYIIWYITGSQLKWDSRLLEIFDVLMHIVEGLDAFSPKEFAFSTLMHYRKFHFQGLKFLI